jgi:hypothetical protein
MLPAQDILWLSALSALGSVGLTIIIRNAPVVRGWVAEAKKPWACNVCMPFYTSAAMIAIPVTQSGDWRYATAFPATYALAYLLLENMSKPPGPPQIPKEFFDE